MKVRIINHVKKNVINGLLAIIPIGLCVVVLKIVIKVINNTLLKPIDSLFPFHIPGLSFILLMLFLYFFGMLSKNFLGKSLLNFIERITSKIPFAKSVYQVGKQVGHTLSTSKSKYFKRVVLCDAFKNDNLMICFVTGSSKLNEITYLRLFIPTAPNPTSGFVVYVDEKETIDPGWTVDDALKTIISGGILGSDEIQKKGKN